jgi:hypothetical protein
MKPPEAVAHAVVRAIEHDRAEVEVASIALRAAAVLAQLRPEWFAALGRRSADEYAARMTEAARDKR